MLKTELVAEIALRTGTKREVVNSIVNTYHEIVIDTLACDEDVTIVGWGRYAVSERPGRPGIHPKTKETLWIAAHKAARLVPSPVVTKRLNTVKEGE